MEKATGIYKRTRSGREEAIKRLREAKSERGTDEEYTEVFLQEGNRANKNNYKEQHETRKSEIA